MNYRYAVVPAALGLAWIATPALAHVTVTPAEGEAGSYAVATINVPHGCDGSATTKVAIQIPEQLLTVTPTRNPLWDVTKEMVTLDTPGRDSHGNEVTERVGQVVYTARAPLPDGYRDAFELSFQVPDSVGETLTFPAIQTCEKGETAWTEVAAEGAEEPEHPAPAFSVLEAEGEEHEAATARAEEEERGLAFGGLVLGGLGLAAGGAALVRSRKS